MGKLEGNNGISVHYVVRYLYQKIYLGYQKLKETISSINRTILNSRMHWVFTETPYKNISHEFLVSQENFLYFLQIEDSVSSWMPPIYAIEPIDLLS